MTGSVAVAQQREGIGGQPTGGVEGGMFSAGEQHASRRFGSALLLCPDLIWPEPQLDPLGVAAQRDHAEAGAVADAVAVLVTVSVVFLNDLHGETQCVAALPVERGDRAWVGDVAG